RNPVGFDDVFSWILVLLAVIFGIFATYKGYRFDDAYPGYGELDRELDTRRRLYEAKKAEYCRLVDQVFDRILDEQARLLTDVKANIEYYQQLVGKSDDERRAFVHEAAEIQDACNILLKRYRQANARARTSPAPFYFNNSVAFEGSLVGPPEAISEDEARLSRSYESAIKDFSDIARQNDATVQNLRTAEIRRREYYFSKLERDIRERLIREAWETKSLRRAAEHPGPARSLDPGRCRRLHGRAAGGRGRRHVEPPHHRARQLCLSGPALAESSADRPDGGAGRPVRGLDRDASAIRPELHQGLRRRRLQIRGALAHRAVHVQQGHLRVAQRAAAAPELGSVPAAVARERPLREQSEDHEGLLPALPGAGHRDTRGEPH